MSDISGTDMRFLDGVFEMDDGQPLDFSIRTLQGFFLDEFGIDLFTSRYAERGTSKANRLRTFLANENNELVSRALQALWDYREIIEFPDSKPQITRRQYAKLMRKLGAELDGEITDEQASTTDSSRPTESDRSKLAAKFMGLYPLDPHPRGFAFETFLSDLFDIYGLEPRGSFRKRATQIDGSFSLDNELYLLEAKWQNSQSNAAELFTFEGKVGRGASWTRGLFVSHAGFSEGALDELGSGRSIVCVNGLDIHETFERGLHFDEVIRKKVRRAAENGQPYTPIRDLFP